MYLKDKQLYIDNDHLYTKCDVCGKTMHNTINGCVHNFLKCSSCNTGHDILVNRREHLRKSINSKARCFSAKQGAFDAKILNISKGGLKFVILTNAIYNFVVEDCVRLVFCIQEEKVEILVQIVNLCDQNSFGCIFLEEYSPRGTIEQIDALLQTKIP